jgi:uncharacterized damage-inducible protein DinB
MVKEKVVSTIKLLDQITGVLEPEMYAQRLGSLRSNSIGEQLWCLAGARESYLAAISNDTDFKWTCSFSSDANSKPDIDLYLLERSKEFLSFLEKEGELSNNQLSLLLDFLAHEYQHQGQLIRYLYGNKLPLPEGWRKLWHLEQ